MNKIAAFSEIVTRTMNSREERVKKNSAPCKCSGEGTDTRLSGKYTQDRGTAGK